MSEPFELTIDGKTVEADGDTTILQAAAKVGIKIPTLCYDPRLKPFGACRLCLVEVEQMRGRLIPACSTPVSKGMIVHTATEQVKKARRMVLELLLIHHPLDCPVCDKAGECKLQDATFEYGAQENRFMYGQVKFHDTIETRSHLIERDTNRCILCGLCVRACDEVQSTGEINFVGRGFPTKIGTAFDKEMNCEFCGQCIAICPVGALNSKVFKHKVRVWDLEKTTTTCAYCGVGCTIDIESRRGKVYRVKAEYGKGINEGNLCGKGRFGWEYIHDEKRLTQPLIRKDGKLVPATWDEAAAKVAKGIKAIVDKDGADAVAGLATPRLTNEDAFLFAKLMKDTFGVASVDTAASHFIGPMTKQAGEQLGQDASTGTYADIRKAGVVLVANSSTQEANPVVGNRIVHQKRFGESALLTVHPRKMKLARWADKHVPAPFEATPDVLLAMCAAIVEKDLADESAKGRKEYEAFAEQIAAFSPATISAKWGLDADAIVAAAEKFAQSGPGMVVLGAVPFADALNRRVAAAAIDLLLLTGNIGGPGAGLLIMAEKNNMQGVLDAGLTPGEGGKNAKEIVDALDAGRLKALYLAGENVITNFPGGSKRAEALESLEFLVVNELFPTAVTEHADVVLPAAAFAERSGSFTNSERRAQKVRRALDAPGEAKADGDIFIEIASAAGAEWEYGSAEEALKDLAGVAHAGVDLDAKAFKSALCQKDLSEGIGDKAAGLVIPETAEAAAAADGEYPLQLEIGPVLYHSGTLSVRAPQLTAVLPGATVEISRSDAANMKIEDGDEVTVSSAAGSIAATARVTKHVADGNAFVPFHFETAPALSLMTADGALSKVRVSK